MSFTIDQMRRQGAKAMKANPKIKLNKLHDNDRQVDVFIAGSGPIGATYAKYCVEAGLTVVMTELGAADSFKATASIDGSPDAWVPGYHKKNEIEYQKDIDRFVFVIKGALQSVSVVTRDQFAPTLDPGAWSAAPGESAISLGKNPHQEAYNNLPAQQVTRGVGGMTTHWTCATPRLHKPMANLPNIGRPTLNDDPAKDDEEWNALYAEAEGLIKTKTNQFDQSIRHTLVLKTLQKAYREKRRVFEPLPLAATRLERAPEYVEWHSASDIFESIYINPTHRKRFTLLTNHRCTRFALADGLGTKVGFAEVRNLLSHRTEDPEDSYIQAKVFVNACGAVATPQILYNSGFSGFERQPRKDSLIPNLGKYITEQPMSFCQVVMRQDLIDEVDSNPFGLDWWKKAVDSHRSKNPTDAIHIPFRDPEPQVTSLFQEDHPWHTQIHRDAFSYGAVGPEVDSRLIVDFRFFGAADPEESNMIIFENDVQDAYGMPQPTFNYRPSRASNERSHAMMADMCEVASKLGGYLPTAPPQFMDPGLALHLAGTTRIGRNQAETVADDNGKIWKIPNLYVAGNNVIRTGFGENPTLTSICYAIKSAKSIIKEIGGSTNAPNAIASGRYVLRNLQTGTVFDLGGSNTAPGSPVIGWTSTNGNNQKWDLTQSTGTGKYRIASALSSNVYAGVANDANDEAISARSSPTEWTLTPGRDANTYIITSSNGLAIDMAGASAQPGTRIILWQKNGQLNQQWRFESAA